jgi:hypothetical protein
MADAEADYDTPAGEPARAALALGRLSLAVISGAALAVDDTRDEALLPAWSWRPLSDAVPATWPDPTEGWRNATAPDDANDVDLLASAERPRHLADLVAEGRRMEAEMCREAGMGAGVRESAAGQG